MKKDTIKVAIAIGLALVLALTCLFAIAFLKDKKAYTPKAQKLVQDSESKPKESDIQTEKPELSLEIERVLSGHDKDSDGLDDLDDIIAGARKDAENKPSYRSAYYRGGYPPDDEGVCTDVVWRAFKEAGYDLKDLMDKDIKKNTSLYKRVTESGGPDPNIDFRRVPNQAVFFSRFAISLTLDIIPGDIENLKEWQGGDIVVFGGSVKHVAIVSDMRRSDGVPYIIHNAGPYTREEDALLTWHEISNISHHFRWIKD